MKSANSRIKIKNFWNMVLYNNNCTQLQITDLLGAKKSTVSAYFSGFLMPKDDVIHTLCDYFDVDFDTGRNEFRKAYETWGKVHSDKYVKSGDTYTCRKDTALKKSAQIPKSKTIVKESKKSSSNKQRFDTYKYARALYKRLLFNDFIGIYDCKSHEDVLRLIYDKVNFDIFAEIDAIK